MLTDESKRYGMRGAVAGVDGCPGGWLAIIQDSADGSIRPRVFSRFDDLIDSADCPQVIAIDIPIGLTDTGPRACDLSSRKRVGPRCRSVFPAPIRPALGARTRLEAHEISMAVHRKGVGAHTFAIYGKVREVDSILQARQELRDRVFEIHPELCFATWSGEPISHPKRSGQGFLSRLTLVESEFGPGAFESIRSGVGRSRVADDDILDAFAALWTAKRIHAGIATRCPDEPEVDATGLPMVMWT